MTMRTPARLLAPLLMGAALAAQPPSSIRFRPEGDQQRVDIHNVTYHLAPENLVLRKTVEIGQVIGDKGMEAKVTVEAWPVASKLAGPPLYSVSLSGVDATVVDNALLSVRARHRRGGVVDHPPPARRPPPVRHLCAAGCIFPVARSLHAALRRAAGAARRRPRPEVAGSATGSGGGIRLARARPPRSAHHLQRCAARAPAAVVLGSGAHAHGAGIAARDRGQVPRQLPRSAIPVRWWRSRSSKTTWTSRTRRFPPDCTCDEAGSAVARGAAVDRLRAGTRAGAGAPARSRRPKPGTGRRWSR